MIQAVTAVAAPSDDKRWKIVNATIRRHGEASHALIETLHTVQEAFGFLDDEALEYVALRLGLPLSEVYGVATFYHYFTLKPQGEHSCVFCTGTACYIRGAGELKEQVEQEFNVAEGETTEDGKLSVLSARCLGSCGLAPAVILDGDVKGNVGSKELMTQVRKWVNE